MRWRPVALALSASLVLSLAVRVGILAWLPALAVAAHAAFPATRAWLVWATHRPHDRARRAIVLGYALAAVALGATWGASWRAPAVYDAAMVTTRWVAALLVTLGWTGAERQKDEGRGNEPRPPARSTAARLTDCSPPDRRANGARYHVNGPRAVASILGSGHALGLVGAWMCGEPRRDWYLARGLTWAEYAVCGVVMLVCLIRDRCTVRSRKS